MNKIKNYLTLAATSILMAPMNLVHATGSDGLFDTSIKDKDSSAVKEIWNSVSGTLSLVLNVACWGSAIALVAAAVFNFVGFFREENAGKAQEKKSSAIKCLIGAAIAASGVLIINLLASNVNSIF